LALVAPRHDVVDRYHGGEHRMVLVVVAVHPVATDEPEVSELLEPRAHLPELRVGPEVRGVGPRYSQHDSVPGLSGADGAERNELALGECDHLGVALPPELVAAGAEVLGPDP